MAQYRAIVEHVRYWRGAVHRWSTSYELTGTLTKPLDTTAAQTLLLADDKLCYSQVAGDGGTFACRIYASGGGTPLATYTRFDWTTPASWIAYGGATAWGSPSATFCSQAETAALIQWPAGLSVRGKPIFFRKYIHAVPATSGSGAGADITGSVLTSLANQALATGNSLYSAYGITLGNARTVPGPPTVKPFYVTHQMPRGRRRKVSAATARSLSDQIFQLVENQNDTSGD